MRALVDIVHPAHVHFFRHPLRILEAHGHEVRVTSRDKDCTLELLDRFRIEHAPLTARGRGVGGLAAELLRRDRALLRVARSFRPDVITGLGGVCAAHVGRLTGTRSVVFYDTENAHLQNALTYPFAHRVVVPRCYRGWVPRWKTSRYAGYHELSYLHPARFTPDREVALANGLAPHGETFLVRVVSWDANHDLGVAGWSAGLLHRVVERLARSGTVLLSAEGALPATLERYRYRGDVAALHHVVAFCRATVGESATIASEAAVLGVPSVYAATVSRGYVDEQHERYAMVRVVPPREDAVLAAVDDTLATTPEEFDARKQALLSDTIDVAAYVADELEGAAR